MKSGYKSDIHVLNDYVKFLEFYKISKTKESKWKNNLAIYIYTEYVCKNIHVPFCRTFSSFADNIQSTVYTIPTSIATTVHSYHKHLGILKAFSYNKPTM